MIHYTPLDPQVIWGDWEEKPVPLEEHQIDGIRLLMRKINDQTWRVEQVLSTYPMDFLNPHYQPGTLYGLKPQLFKEDPTENLSVVGFII